MSRRFVTACSSRTSISRSPSPSYPTPSQGLRSRKSRVLQPCGSVKDHIALGDRTVAKLNCSAGRDETACAPARSHLTGTATILAALVGRVVLNAPLRQLHNHLEEPPARDFIGRRAARTHKTPRTPMSRRFVSGVVLRTGQLLASGKRFALATHSWVSWVSWVLGQALSTRSGFAPFQ